MRLDINLASQPYQDAGNFWVRWGLALAGVFIVTAALAAYTTMQCVQARREQADINSIRDKIAALTGVENNARSFLNRPENRDTRDRSEFLNDLFHHKAFSWTKVFEDLEQVMPAHLHVVSIHPELDSDDELEIKLTVAGESRDRALELVRKMEDSRRFRQTAINRENAQGGGQEVQFDISALYVPEPITASPQGGK
ncbi:MAG TPA: PilN domain-containing protein [Terriglobales bacterium]|nr:PilN domain-containing protein [Terriglobales bacterium]